MQSLIASLSGLIPVIVGLLILVAFFALLRRLIFIGDEIALFSLMLNGIREVFGPSRFTAGCAMLAITAVGSVTFLLLIALNTATCFTSQPSAFCQIVPGLGR